MGNEFRIFCGKNSRNNDEGDMNFGLLYMALIG